jgi:hypothetical protein
MGDAVHTAAGGSACFSSPAGTADPPCFRNDTSRLQLHVADTVLELTDVQVAATFSGDRLTSGLISGFLSYAAARAATVPSDVPLCGGSSAFDMLRGGDSCQSGDDRDGAGWRVNFSWEGTRVDWNG